MKNQYTPYRSGHQFIKNQNDIDLHRQIRYQQYRTQYEEWPKSQIVADFPTHLDIEISSACNLKCPTCNTVYLDDPSFKKYKDGRLSDAFMTFDLFKQIIDEASKYEHFFSIKLNYRGESTLHPDIINMIEYAKEKKVLDIMLNSNGNYDVSLTREMIEAGLTWLSISLDALYPETYKQIRINGDYFKAYSVALDMCRFLTRANLQVSFVLQKKNQNEKDHFVEFWKNMPVHKIVISDFYNPGELIKNENLFSIGNRMKYDKFTCPQLWQRLVVFNDGRIFPCCHSFMGSEEMHLGQFPVISLYNAWNSEKAKNLRCIHSSGEYYKIKTCSVCAYPKTKES